MLETGNLYLQIIAMKLEDLYHETSIKPHRENDEYTNFLNHFPDLLQTTSKRNKPTDTVVHHIKTEELPVSASS